MDKPRTSGDSLIVAIVLLLLPVLYVLSYLALVTPSGPLWSARAGHYRVCPQVCSVVFWPLEQLDRKVRPNAWAGWHR